MKKIVLSALSVLLLLASPALSDVGIRYAALGYQQVTASGSAQGLTIPTGTSPTSALICVETADVRWRDDGTDPTTGVGMPLLHATPCYLYTGPIANFRFIAISGSPILDVSYYQ